jgi:hypothetical protein
MAIDKLVKKSVIKDWQEAFPQLMLYSQDKLYKVIGPIIIGLELIKLPRTDEYRPHFVIYPLWKKDVRTSLDFPIILKEFYNNQGLQYSISYEKHRVFFNDILESVKKQVPISFNDENISLKNLIDVIDEHSKTRPLSAAPNSYLQALLQEAKFKAALYIGTHEAEIILEQINKRSWDENHFKAFGMDAGKWIQKLKEIISQRENFLDQIAANKEDKKLQKLKNSELIP